MTDRKELISSSIFIFEGPNQINQSRGSLHTSYCGVPKHFHHWTSSKNIRAESEVVSTILILTRGSGHLGVAGRYDTSRECHRVSWTCWECHASRFRHASRVSLQYIWYGSGLLPYRHDLAERDNKWRSVIWRPKLFPLFYFSIINFLLHLILISILSYIHVILYYNTQFTWQPIKSKW